MRKKLIASMIGIKIGLIPISMAQNKTPNIIILLTDDQGWGDLGFNGNLSVRTPNIDQLAEESARFENFYVCPISAPSRAEFLTGRYYVRCGVSSVSEGGERINSDEATLAEYFHNKGYATGCFGKWHNGTQYPYHPNARGFDEFYGFCSGHWANYWSPILEHNGEITQGHNFLPDDLTDKAIEFIRANQQKPFLLYLPYNTPHSPMQIPDRWWDRIKNRPILQYGSNPLQEDTLFTKSALALAENIDWNIGRLLDYLKQSNLDDNTIIAYLSDNGPNSNRWNGGMKGQKGSIDEGGVRSPLCIYWKNHIKPHKVKQLSGIIDLLPTLLSLSNVQYQPKKELDGIDLSPFLLNPHAPIRQRVLYSYWNEKIGVRIPNYFLDNSDKLYDLRNDRNQHYDIAQNEPAILSKMKLLREDFERNILKNFSTKDNRPFPIGHPSEHSAKLPFRDAKLSGGIKRSCIYPNCSYSIDWCSEKDEITWEIENIETGIFETIIYYVCDDYNSGSILELKTDRNNESLTFQLKESNPTPMLGAELDRIPRMESYGKGFKPYTIGNIPIKKGRTKIILHAKSIAKEEVMNFWMLELKRIK